MDHPDLPAAPASGRRAVAALWAAVLAPLLLLSIWVPFARSAGLPGGVPAVVVLGVVIGALAGATSRLSARLPSGLDGWLAPENRRLAALWGAGALLALWQIGKMAMFLGDSGQTWASIVPDEPFLVRHSCLTAYMHGAILSLDPATNVYDMAFVDSAPKNLPLPATAAHFAPFTLDAYGYPPPFLLLPRAVLLLTRDFMIQRVWFSAGSLALIMLACASAARALGGVAERRIWLLTPLFLCCPVVLLTLQIGNFHLAAVALCILCWVALEERRDGLAGALLAVAILAKIFPGLLGVLLLMQRRWRAVGATAVSAAALSAISVVVLGAQVWRDFFFYHLPRVQSGEALRFMAEASREIRYNLAPFGIPFKLASLGLAGWGWEQARIFGSAYTVLLFAVAVAAGRRGGGPRHRLSAWLGLVMLASLRSPYAASFVLVTVNLMLLTMTAEALSRRSTAAFLVAWAFFSIPVPIHEPQAAMAWSLGYSLVTYVFLLWVILRRDRPAPAPGS